MKFAILMLPLLFSITAIAQTAIPNLDSAKALVAPMQFTHNDTVRALHNLFKSRRHTGIGLVEASAILVAIAGLGTLADNNGKGHGGFFNPNAAEASLIVGIGFAPAWIPGTITFFRFTKKREQEAVAEYEHTRQIPHYIQTKLAGRFFNQNYHIIKSSGK